MSSNQCPVCQAEAMDSMTKLMKRPHVCQSCGAELRMNLIFTAIVSILYFILAVRFMLNNGLGGGMLYVIILTIVFVGACLFIPLEAKQSGNDS
jgi:hypothetical protein